MAKMHVDQLRPCFGTDKDKDPGDNPVKMQSAQFDKHGFSKGSKYIRYSSHSDVGTGDSPMTTSTEHIIRDNRSDSKTRDTGVHFGISQQINPQLVGRCYGLTLNVHDYS